MFVPMQVRPAQSTSNDRSTQLSPGSNVIVAGTAIFNAEDAKGVIDTLKASVNTAQAKAT